MNILKFNNGLLKSASLDNSVVSCVGDKKLNLGGFMSAKSNLSSILQLILGLTVFCAVIAGNVFHNGIHLIFES